MHSQYQIHDCKDIRVESHQPTNGNHIALTITTDFWGKDENGLFDKITGEVRVSMFGLPTEVTDALISALSKEREAA